MKLIDGITKEEYSNIVIFLKKEELSELIDSLMQLRDEPVGQNHYHIPNADYSKEITITSYDDNSEI